MVSKESLELRKKMKAKKPTFRNQSSHMKKKLSDSWRWPRGWQSKVRLKRKSHLKIPKQGYRSPADVRNLTKEGLVPVIVYNTKDLNNIKKEQKAILSSTIGKKKKVEILKLAKEKGIAININIDKALQKIEDIIKQRKEKKKKTSKKKEESKKEREKKAEKKDGIDQKVEQTPEEKQKQEKKEKDKILTTTN